MVPNNISSYKLVLPSSTYIYKINSKVSVGLLRGLCVRWNCKIKRDLPVRWSLIVISSTQNPLELTHPPSTSLWNLHILYIYVFTLNNDLLVADKLRDLCVSSKGFCVDEITIKLDGV